jgi:hypothetical protein
MWPRKLPPDLEQAQNSFGSNDLIGYLKCHYHSQLEPFDVFDDGPKRERNVIA